MSTRVDEAPGPRGTGRQWVFWIGTPLAIFGLGLVGLALRAPGLPIALWWPAAGASMWFALRTRETERRWALAAVLVATAASNAVAGRPLAVCVLYGAFNALEIAIVLGVLGRDRDRFRLTTLTNAARFVAASLLGALFLGTAVATTGVLLTGSAFFPASVVALASHSSAIMLIGGLAILPPRESVPVHPGEVALHLLTAGTTILVAFGPAPNAHLAFLVFAVLAGGCLRFPIRVAASQALLICIIVLVLTVAAGARVGGDVDARVSAVTVVVFMSTVGVFTLLVASARYEGRASAALAIQAAQDVAEAERARAAALTQQLEFERRREDFATVAGHELRTPLTNIVGYTELLLDSPLDAEQRSWTETVRRGAARLTGLLDDLADAHERGERASLSVDALMEDACAAHAAQATARRTTIRTEQSGLRVVTAESDARRALWSLVSNAVTFAENGTVTVTASRDGDDVLITVRDDGPGMSEGTLAHAFERFYRGPEAEGRSAGGLGLGLANARDLARRNHGDVTIASEAGEGVTATLRLPVDGTATP